MSKLYNYDMRRVQQIKDSIDRPTICGYLPTSSSRRSRTARYLGGAARIVGILRDRLSSWQVREYDRLHHAAMAIPENWVQECHDAARKLWQYASSMDMYVPRPPERHVHFQDRHASAFSSKPLAGRYAAPSSTSSACSSCPSSGCSCSATDGSYYSPGWNYQWFAALPSVWVPLQTRFAW
ncbi:uncharacterized protein BXZ73DRAFT_98822 [Epithele typhae]|uniref:uncharacterized protein n=1 Tax=Epithele typhae TaxID=378194 RepID=UPI002008725A|nr:uncharacterized protein BXZ73DRAFT_98822 [Epithele typhae]KAH9940384.1 hypothetical protein BXZ73DRAFT_98822 [Epithele typhae]